MKKKKWLIIAAICILLIWAVSIIMLVDHGLHGKTAIYVCSRAGRGLLCLVPGAGRLCTYLHRKTRNYIFDVPTTVDDLLELGLSRKELAQKLCDRCNQLGKMAL